MNPRTKVRSRPKFHHSLWSRHHPWSRRSAQRPARGGEAGVEGEEVGRETHKGKGELRSEKKGLEAEEGEE